MKSVEPTWRKRIVGYDDVDPTTLVENPLNWRVHTESQQGTIDDVLGEIGWIQSVVVNKTTGHIVDGHMRVSLALKRKEKSVPVVWVELSEEEEKKALATFDPISEMAGADLGSYEKLSSELATDSLLVRDLIDRTRQSADSFNEMEESDVEVGGNIIPEMELAPFEHYDYIVLLFRNDQDFSGACEKLGVGKVSVKIPDSGKVKVGLGRVVDGAKVLKILDEK